MDEREYAFDVKLWAVCRVRAETEAEARAKMLETIACINIAFDHDGVSVTEANIEDDGDESELFEVDGVDPNAA